MNNSRVAIAFSVLLTVQPLLMPIALADPLLAQDGGTPSGRGVTTYTPDPSPTPTPPSTKVDTENWPWMQKEKAKSAGAETLKSEKMAPEKPVMDQGQLLKPESPVTVAPAPKPQAASAPAKSTPFKLYGRIDQLTGSAGASFPSLKAMVPKMDSRGMKPLQAKATDSRFSGTVVNSFPISYAGTWGGNLQLHQQQISPLYYQIDPSTAQATGQALHAGLIGACNLQFANWGKKVSLEPAKILFMVPMKDTVQANQFAGMQGGGGNPFSAMIGQMTQSMQVPLVMSLGEMQSSAASGTVSVSGGQVRTQLVKNDIRELAPGTLEQQIITKEVIWDPKTGQPHNTFGETVVRCTLRNPQQMYVEIATVTYSADKRFLMKDVIIGWVTKGALVNTDPMSAAMGGAGAGGLGGLGGMGGLGGLEKMLGGQKGNGGTPQIPGLDPNMLKNMFGQ